MSSVAKSTQKKTSKMKKFNKTTYIPYFCDVWKCDLVKSTPPTYKKKNL